MTRINTQAAYTMGQIAYAQGIKCAPSLDKLFMDNMAGRQVGDQRNMFEMKAWAKGWADANLSANIAN